MAETREVATDSATWPWKRVLLAMVPGVAFMTAFLMRSRSQLDGRFTLFDDAMISMSYARTLADTGEWIWFPGAERLQGFTNLLWTLYMALLHQWGLEGSAAALAVSVTGAILTVGCSVLVARIVWCALSVWAYGGWAAAVAGGTVPLIYPLVFWSIRGMEVGLLALLTLMLISGLLWLRRRWSSHASPVGPLIVLAVAGSLGVLTRLDFVVIAVPVVVLAVWWAPDLRARMNLILAFAVPLAVTAALLLAFQQVYYGDWLTNTYRLKMEGFSVGDRLQRGVVAAAKSLPLTLLVMFAPIASLRGRLAHRLWPATVALSLVWFAALAYSIWVGGDAWEWANMGNRYLAVGMPSAVAAVLIGLGALMTAHRIPDRALLGALTLFTLSGLGFAAATNPFELSPKSGALATAALLVASALLYLAFRRFWLSPQSAGRAIAVLAAGGFAVVCATSAVAGLLWVRDGGIHTQDDAALTSRTLELRELTDGQAVVASVWAGAPGYYSDRRMIDLLGKSDKLIAGSAPASVPEGTAVSTFFPGHNKWNLDYSIGQMRPDVILDASFPIEGDLRRLSEWGYVRLCASDGVSAFYFLSNSPYVKWNQLYACTGASAAP